MPTSHLAGLQMPLYIQGVMRAKELKIQTDSSTIYVIIVLASLLFFPLITIYLKLAETRSICFSMMSPSFFSFSLSFTWLPTQSLLHAFDFKQNHVFFFSLLVCMWLSEKKNKNKKRIPLIFSALAMFPPQRLSDNQKSNKKTWRL